MEKNCDCSISYVTMFSCTLSLLLLNHLLMWHFHKLVFMKTLIVPFHMRLYSVVSVWCHWTVCLCDTLINLLIIYEKKTVIVLFHMRLCSVVHSVCCSWTKYLSDILIYLVSIYEKKTACSIYCATTFSCTLSLLLLNHLLVWNFGILSKCLWKTLWLFHFISVYVLLYIQFVVLATFW